jgi:hypothetical protein
MMRLTVLDSLVFPELAPLIGSCRGENHPCSSAALIADLLVLSAKKVVLLLIAPSLVPAVRHPCPLPIWEARTSWLDLIAFWRTSKNILFHPGVTFTALNYEAGIHGSLVYLLVYGSLGQIIGRYWFTLLGIRYGILQGNALGNTIHFGVAVLLTPIVLFASILIVAGLVHLVLRILRATRRPFAATLQVMAYASGATSLVNVIPFVGRFIMPIWALVLYFVGLVKAHQTSKTRVFVALLLPLVLAGLFVTGIVLLHTVKHVLDFLEAIQQTL